MSDLTMQVPNASQLQSISCDYDYSGHGTTLLDVLVVAIPFALVTTMIVLWVLIYYRHEGTR